MRPRNLVLALGALAFAWVLPAKAETPYDSSILPYATKQDPRPDPRKVPRFIEDQPREIDGLYARFGTSAAVIQWLIGLRNDWDPLRDQRIDRNANLIDLRKSIPEEGAALMKVIDGTECKVMLTFNSKHNGVPFDALYQFSQSRKTIAVAEAEVLRCEAKIAAAIATVDAAAARKEIHDKGKELDEIRARREQIMKDAKKGIFQGLLKFARTAIDAIKDPAKAAQTLGLDLAAEGLDMALTEMALLDHANELANIAEREEIITKIIADDRIKDVRSQLEAANQELKAQRIAMIQATIRGTIALADAKHQLLKLKVLEEGDGAGAPKLFRALSHYHTTTDIMAGYVDVSAKEYLKLLSEGTSARAGRLHDYLAREIEDVKRFRGDFSTWLTNAEHTRHFLSQHYSWYNRQHAEALKVLAAYDARAHWNFTESAVSHLLVTMKGCSR